MKKLFALCARPAASLRQAWWALPLPLIAGFGFMEHGYAKLVRGHAGGRAFRPAGIRDRPRAGGSGPLALDSVLFRPHPENAKDGR